MKKVWKIAGIVLACVVLLAVVTVGCLWGNEILTLTSIKEIAPANDDHRDGYVYEITVSGDYYFDQFLEAGGASSDKELISFITSCIGKGMIPLQIEESSISCSSFTAVTEEGDRVFGRNYDFDKTNTAIVYTNPGNGRHASVSTVDLQFLGIDPDTGITGLADKFLCLAAPYAPLDGVNDAGVSCGIYMTYQGAETVATDQQTDKPDITSTTMLRMILDYASTVDEAIELVEQYDLHDSANTSYHYMVADAQGNSAILEWVAGTDQTDNDGSARQLKVIRNDPQQNYQCVTNFVLTPGYYEEGDEMGGKDRYDLLTSTLANSDGVVADDQAAMDVLALVGRRTWVVEGDHTQGTTVHSVVYNLTDCTALWVGNEHYGEEAYTFQLQTP